MSLASLDDIRTWLPPDKFQVTDGNTEIQYIQNDVARVIKGYLRAVFPETVISGWTTPSTTPEYIRACAGRLVAAFYYIKRTSEAVPDWERTYPQRLYNEAMAMLDAVRNGDVILAEVGEAPGTDLSTRFFYPTKEDEPSFTMDMVW